MGRKFEWDAILPTAGFDTPPPDELRPRDAHEHRWLAEWSIPMTRAEMDEAANVPGEQPSSHQFLFPSRGTRDRYIEEADGRRFVLVLPTNVRGRIVHQVSCQHAGRRRKTETASGRLDGRRSCDDRLRPNRRRSCQESSAAVDGRHRRGFCLDVFAVGRRAVRHCEARDAPPRRGQCRPRGRRREASRHPHRR